MHLNYCKGSKGECHEHRIQKTRVYILTFKKKAEEWLDQFENAYSENSNVTPCTSVWQTKDKRSDSWIWKDDKSRLNVRGMCLIVSNYTLNNLGGFLIVGVFKSMQDTTSKNSFSSNKNLRKSWKLLSKRADWTHGVVSFCLLNQITLELLSFSHGNTSKDGRETGMSILDTQDHAIQWGLYGFITAQPERGIT